MVREQFPYDVRSVEHAWIELPDGVRLHASIRRPDTDRRVPAILEYLPYRKDDGTLERDQRHHGYLAGFGFACIRVDLRGSGDSEGLLLGEYLETELADGELVIAWISEQAWCNGAVGMMGISWGGFNALQIAARRPPALRAAVSVAATVDRYATDVHYRGGCVLATDMLPWSATMLCFNARPPTPSIVGDRWREQWLERLEATPVFVHDWLAHQRRDAFWEHGSVGQDFGAIECPVLSIGGFADGYTDTVFHLLEGLAAPARGIVGPWSHNYPTAGAPGPNIGFLQEVVDFFATRLGGDHRPTAPERVPWDDPLRVWVQRWVRPTSHHTERPGRWVSEPSWPSPNVGRVGWYLAPDRLQRQAPEPTIVTGRDDVTVGLRQGAWWGYAAPGQLPTDQRLEEPAAFRFLTDPLPASSTILGSPEVALRLRVDRPSALVGVRLCDVAPDGSSLQLSRGLLNLCHRDGHDRPTPLVPGETYEVTVVLDSIAHDVPAGHRLELHVSTALWPLAWPSPAQVELSLELGTGCRLWLPVRSADAGELGEPAFERPEVAATDAFVVEPPVHHRSLTEDQTTGRVALTDRTDSGVVRLDSCGTEMSSAATDTWEITRGDPLSARVRCERTWTIRWDAIPTEVRTTEVRTIEVRTESEMWCDATHFHTEDRLHAFERGIEVHASTRTFSTPRDCV
jgi:putative CocE/NonD family hydrolase